MDKQKKKRLVYLMHHCPRNSLGAGWVLWLHKLQSVDKRPPPSIFISNLSKIWSAVTKQCFQMLHQLKLFQEPHYFGETLKHILPFKLNP
ncbi:hypothetical protein GDO86_015729 [Hymenochirus boettgeri]|uniref:Uncharacterized protein n=1 Tax=Hymenochirus boettgeri TaxID=247094 RepID=A0A8T2JYJ8_9PIPI|nr:hypothetical protein GDO86_015729 [Hymenochirus boettgeri]